jgi:hypothetical protein
MIGPQPADAFAWFAMWANERLSVCLTFARGLRWQAMLDGFGVPASDVTSEQGMAQTSGESSVVRVGSNGEWGWAIEQFTARGTTREMLSRLSARGGEAISLTLTPTVSSILYARDGALVSGFDLTASHIRYGSEPNRFDPEMGLAGIGEESVPDPPILGARFVHIAFGLLITRGMLDGAVHLAPTRDHGP